MIAVQKRLWKEEIKVWKASARASDNLLLHAIHKVIYNLSRQPDVTVTTIVERLSTDYFYKDTPRIRAAVEKEYRRRQRWSRV